MTETESRPAEPKTELEEQVRLISIGYYVVAGLTGLFSLIPGIHITIGMLALLGKFEPDPSSGDFPAELFGGIFVAVGSLLMLMGFTLTALVAIAGRKLKQFKSRTYCLVIAAVLCAIFPLGTVLGVFTILILSKPEAKTLFSS